MRDRPLSTSPVPPGFHPGVDVCLLAPGRRHSLHGLGLLERTVMIWARAAYQRSVGACATSPQRSHLI